MALARPSPLEIRSTAEFARYVGLARTTISRVLNGHPGVKPKTVERVRKALEETGFTPNALAMHLRGKRTNMVGVCMQNLLTPPMVAKLASLQRRLRLRGITSMIEAYEHGALKSIVQHFQAMQAGAVVFIGHFPPAELAERVTELGRRRIPHLVIDQADVLDANAVYIDRVEGMRLVMDHLLDLGHRRFGILGISGPYKSITDRLEGVRTALAARGFDPDEATVSLDHMYARENNFDFGRTLAGIFARRTDCPTAFVAVNDEVAIGAMLAFEDLGFAIPQDISIAGFNNQEICMMTSPTLTSIDQCIEATVEAAAELLVSQLEAPSTERLVRKIAPFLVQRGSCARAPRTG